MDLLHIAVSSAISAAGTLALLGITFGRWVVNRLAELDKRLSIVETKQANDRDAKDQLLETVQEINRLLLTRKR